MKNRIFLFVIASCSLGVFGLMVPAFPALGAGGPLEPPGPPGPTMKTLDAVEPRRAISALPFVIDEPGSYYLTGDLTGEEGITIEAGAVTLDLMGFAVAGGTGKGIAVSGEQKNITIRNGVIRGWGGDGVDARSAGNSSLENLKAYGNGGAGLWVGESSLIVECQAEENGAVGLQANSGSIIRDSVARGNTGQGIYLSRDGTIASCVASENESDGIYVQYGGALLSECTAAGNKGHGIRIWGGSSTVLNNNARGNEEWGIRISGRGCRIDSNNVVGNYGGIRVGNDDNLIVRNTAQDNGSAYAFVTGNQVGPTGSIDDVGMHPWANFEF